jgi:hypothetical protein
MELACQGGFLWWHWRRRLVSWVEDLREGARSPVARIPAKSKDLKKPKDSASGRSAFVREKSYWLSEACKKGRGSAASEPGFSQGRSNHWDGGMLGGAGPCRGTHGWVPGRTTLLSCDGQPPQPAALDWTRHVCGSTRNSCFHSLRGSDDGRRRNRSWGWGRRSPVVDDDGWCHSADTLGSRRYRTFHGRQSLTEATKEQQEDVTPNA